MLLRYLLVLSCLDIPCCVLSSVQHRNNCGWLYGTDCTTNKNQPWCIDKTFCQAPPFHPVCGLALPLCSTSQTEPKPLPTLPPLHKKDKGGWEAGPVAFFVPKDDPTQAPKHHFPRILNAPVSPITLKENDPLKLTCSVLEDNNTTVTWIRKKDNMTIAQGKDLVINKIQQKDAGNYLCVAKNMVGTAQVHTNVNVQCSPRAPEGNQQKVYQVKTGEKITLRCETKCTPEPYYVWHKYTEKNNILKTCEPPRVVQNEQHLGEKYSYCDLTVAVKAGDKLTCVKTNSLGNETQTYEINPKPAKTRPKHNQVTESCNNFEAIGCHRSCYTVPYLPELLFIDTGETEKSGDTLYGYTKQLVCRCAKEANRRGFRYFGIASFDQCYAGNDQPKTDKYNSDHRQECLNGRLKPCSSNDAICVGQCCSMFIYKMKGVTPTITGQRRFFNKGFKLRVRRPCSPFKQFLVKTIEEMNSSKTNSPFKELLENIIRKKNSIKAKH